MRVILLQDIYKHGVAGEVVDVADGFARNYLIPRKQAVKATKSELRAFKALREQVEARRAQYEQKLNDVARLIDKTELFFERRAANTGKLFGSVTTQEIAEALDEKTGIDINRRRISQQGLREIGTHVVPVRLGSEVSPELIIHIVREGELAEFLKAREEAEERGETVTVEEVLGTELTEAEAEAQAPTVIDVPEGAEAELLISEAEDASPAEAEEDASGAEDTEGDD